MQEIIVVTAGRNFPDPELIVNLRLPQLGFMVC